MSDENIQESLPEQTITPEVPDVEVPDVEVPVVPEAEESTDEPEREIEIEEASEDEDERSEAGQENTFGIPASVVESIRSQIGESGRELIEKHASQLSGITSQLEQHKSDIANLVDAHAKQLQDLRNGYSSLQRTLQEGGRNSAFMKAGYALLDADNQ